MHLCLKLGHVPHTRFCLDTHIRSHSTLTYGSDSRPICIRVCVSHPVFINHIKPDDDLKHDNPRGIHARYRPRCRPRPRHRLCLLLLLLCVCQVKSDFIYRWRLSTDSIKDSQLLYIERRRNDAFARVIKTHHILIHSLHPFYKQFISWFMHTIRCHIDWVEYVKELLLRRVLSKYCLNPLAFNARLCVRVVRFCWQRGSDKDTASVAVFMWWIPWPLGVCVCHCFCHCYRVKMCENAGRRK